MHQAECSTHDRVKQVASVRRFTCAVRLTGIVSAADLHNYRQTGDPETTHRSNVFGKQGDPETSLGVPFVSSTLTGTIEGNQTIREGFLKQVFPPPVQNLRRVMRRVMLEAIVAAPRGPARRGCKQPHPKGSDAGRALSNPAVSNPTPWIRREGCSPALRRLAKTLKMATNLMTKFGLNLR